ncbi:hypothetical protein [Actinacidiphila sp. bgisy160]|uniref:hypothetical protein n=1 Tax=Actinacidiphila sp. bgisy160 TaxID=3413796 RepID=UPI003D731BAA
MTPQDDEPAPVSSRFFWWTADGLTRRWRPLYLDGWRGGDENCNRTVGIRLPGGVLFACLNVPLRQEPCDDCAGRARH